VAALAELLRRLDPDEVEVVVAALAGEVRQGRIGIGWAAVAGLDVPAAPTATLTVTDLDRELGELAATVGSGSQARRTARLAGLMSAATAEGRTSWVDCCWAGCARAPWREWWPMAWPRRPESRG